MNKAVGAVFAVLILILLGTPEAVFAYGGPGSVISGIGALLAAIGALLAALFGFVWYPLKRLYSSLFGEEQEEEAAVETASE